MHSIAGFGLVLRLRQMPGQAHEGGRCELFGAVARINIDGTHLGCAGEVAQGIGKGLATLAEGGTHQLLDESCVAQGTRFHGHWRQAHDGRIDLGWWAKGFRWHAEQGFDATGQLQHHAQAPVDLAAGSGSHAIDYFALEHEVHVLD